MKKRLDMKEFTVVALEFDELEEWIRSGKITDEYTVAAYGLYNAMNNC